MGILGAAMTGKYVFDIHDGDRFFCGGDVGWITGHTYVVYAPLMLGVTTVVFEGTPAYPDFSRYWDVCERHKVTQFYVAPTALRLLKRAGDHHVKHQMKDMHVLGSVGEPIAAEVWKWYHEIVGKEEAHIVDTYWQTETGSHVISPLGGVTPTKPGSASLPFFGIEPAIIDPVSGEELPGNDVEGVLAFKQPWPSMCRTVYGAHKRYMETYLNVYKGYYFTGDGAAKDAEGYYWIRGRVDDVVNVSGHRLSTAEIEAALIEHNALARQRSSVSRTSSLARLSMLSSPSRKAMSSTTPSEKISSCKSGRVLGLLPRPRPSTACLTCPRRGPARSCAASSARSWQARKTSSATPLPCPTRAWWTRSSRTSTRLRARRNKLKSPSKDYRWSMRN